MSFFRPLSILGYLMFLSPVALQIPIDDIYPFGIEQGDSAVPPIDDFFAGPIYIRRPFPFFGVPEKTLFVNNNGAISFLRGISQFTATCGALPSNLKMIAPFWADVRTGHGVGGAVYYRETTERHLLEKAAKDIQAAYPDLWGLNIDWLFISTWHDVPYYGASICSNTGNAETLRNTFQVVLATDGARSFAIMLYNKITWLSGTASGSTNPCTGTEGKPAKAGFDVGDGTMFFELPGSCTAEIINIDNSSNVGVPGKWIFRIDNTFESTSCNSKKYETERLKISPSFVTAFGTVSISITGPCINESDDVTCRFNDPSRGPVTVAGKVVLGNDLESTDLSVTCRVPIIYSYGRIQIDLIVQDEGLHTAYSGFLYVLEPQQDIEISINPTDTGKWDVVMNWNPTHFNKSSSPLSLVLLEYGESTRTWEERAVLASNISNTGRSTLTLQSVEVRGVVTFSLRVQNKREKRQASNATDDVAGAYARLLCAEALFETDNDAACQAWYEKDNGPPTDVLPCPPLLMQARRDGRFDRDTATGPVLDYFHSGAVIAFRQRTPSPSGAGQECTYRNGRLILGPPGGGTADLVSPANPWNVFEHWRQDVVPWCKCCGYSQREESCRKYYEKRPSDTGRNYLPPRLVALFGDPHIVTFDQNSYTFNGVGEFWMVKSDNFSMQARMEQFRDPSGTLMPASVFTSFVMNDTVPIQVQLSLASGIDVLLNGEVITFDRTAHSPNLHLGNSTISASSDLTQVSVSSATGLSFTFTAANNALSVTATASDSNKGKTIGLLGVFDGDQDNDLTTPDGDVVSPNASLSDIHYEFGLKWIIKQDESMFTYSTGKNYSSYANPSFKPNLEVPDVTLLPENVVEVCQNSVFCLYDYISTGSLSFANQTRMAERDFRENAELLDQRVEMCPELSSPDNGYVNLTNLFRESTAVFECSDGYRMVGYGNLTCLGNKWNRLAPTCRVIKKPTTTTENAFTGYDETLVVGPTSDNCSRWAPCIERLLSGFSQVGGIHFPNQNGQFDPYRDYCEKTAEGGWILKRRFRFIEIICRDILLNNQG